MQEYFLIAIGGALGSLTRYLVGSVVAGRMGTRFPYGTFVINMTACLIIGFSVTFIERHTDQPGMGTSWSPWVSSVPTAPSPPLKWRHLRRCKQGNSWFRRLRRGQRAAGPGCRLARSFAGATCVLTQQSCTTSTDTGHLRTRLSEVECLKPSAEAAFFPCPTTTRSRLPCFTLFSIELQASPSQSRLRPQRRLGRLSGDLQVFFQLFALHSVGKTIAFSQGLSTGRRQYPQE